MANQPTIGKGINRLEGDLKVTGKAKYAAEYQVPDLLYGYIISSSITKGKIISIDTSAAKAQPGVVEVITHENRISLAFFNQQYADMNAPPGSPFRYLKNENIYFNGQPIGLVVADSFEMARYASTLVKITYEQEEFETSLTDNLHNAKEPSTGMMALLKPLPPKPKGDYQTAYDNSFAQTAASFYHGTEHHNPLELFATTTVYQEEGKLTIYDKTQGTVNSQLYVGNVFGLKYKNVQVISPYVGGGFGSGLRPQFQLFFSVLAALQLKKSVRVVLERHHMFALGHRPATLQHTSFSADETGKLTAMHHAALAETSRFEDYIETVVNWGNMIYPVDNTLLRYQLVPMDFNSPLDMRAPGGSTGLHAVESTMDALAYELKMDPLQLRLRNYSDRDDAEDRPYTSKELRECYIQGAEQFGWSERNPEPRSMRRGNKLIGYGMATGIWEANQLPAGADVILTSEGKLIVHSAVTDIGTGTLTVMTQIAADEMGMSIADVQFEYGDSKKPFSPIQGGSYTVSTVGSAIKAACDTLKKKLIKAAQKQDDSPFKGMKRSEFVFTEGKLIAKDDPESSLELKDLAAASKKGRIKASKTNFPNALKLRKYSRATHSAAFVEVEVDEELGVIQVTRALTAVAAGRIINPLTARSQILGGMIWGISKGLMEESFTDYNYGKFMNPNLAEYHIPVHADVQELDVVFVEEKDELINPLGTKGIGEIGIVGMPPAITNAIYHATGKRLNQLPIHFNRLLNL
jgi:xanthine dehydrogenase YagR molybdenum-binding subunit